jgi:type I restriction enzyme, S subunit
MKSEQGGTGERLPRLRFPEFEGEGGWEEKKIGDFLFESRVSGSSGDVAKKLTVKLWGNGVFAKRESIQGSVNTKYFRRKAGQFIYSKLDFLNQAFGIVPEDLDDYESPRIGVDNAGPETQKGRCLCAVPTSVYCRSTTPSSS